MNSYVSKINAGLYQRHSITNNLLNRYTITNIIFNDKMHVVSEFKEWLIYGDANEFLKRYYNIKESIEKIKTFCQFYEMNSIIFPNYCILPESKYLFRNIKRKQKVIDEIEGKSHDQSSLSSGNSNDNKVNDSIKKIEQNGNVMIHSKIFTEQIRESLVTVNNSYNSSQSYIDINKLITKIGGSDIVSLNSNKSHHQQGSNNNNQEQLITSHHNKIEGLSTDVASMFKHHKKFIKCFGGTNLKVKAVHKIKKNTNELLNLKPISTYNKDKEPQSSSHIKQNKHVNKLNIKEIKKLSKEPKTKSQKHKHSIQHNSNILSDRQSFNSKQIITNPKNVRTLSKTSKNMSKPKTSVSPTTKYNLSKPKTPSSNIQTTRLYQKDKSKQFTIHYTTSFNNNNINNSKQNNPKQNSKVTNKLSSTNAALNPSKSKNPQTKLKNYNSKPKYSVYNSNKINKNLNNLQISYSLGFNSTSVHNTKSISQSKSKGKSTSPNNTNISSSNNNNNKVNSSNLIKNSFLKHSTNSNNNNNNNIRTMLSKYNNKTHTYIKINLRVPKTSQNIHMNPINLGKVDFTKQQPKTTRVNYISNTNKVNNSSNLQISLNKVNSKGGNSVQSSNTKKPQSTHKTKTAAHNRNIKSDIQQPTKKQFNNLSKNNNSKVNSGNSHRTEFSSSNKSNIKQMQKIVSPHGKEFISESNKKISTQDSNICPAVKKINNFSESIKLISKSNAISSPYAKNNCNKGKQI